ILCCAVGAQDSARVGTSAPEFGRKPARAGPFLGGAPGAGGKLALPWRVSPRPDASGAGHCSLRPQAALLLYLPLWRSGSWSGLSILCGLGFVVAWLSRPSSAEEP